MLFFHCMYVSFTNLHSVHALRDKISLEGDGFSRDQDEDEDEVFALQGLSEDDDDDEEEDDNENDDEGEGNDDADPDIDSLAESTAKKSASKKGSKRKTIHSSSSESESESEEETWGHKKSAYYSSNAADLDSDDEEGNELEVQEAKRLQAKTREALTDCDFGLEDPIDISLDKDDVA
jgi:U3 small nucleolar RNA-associated protein 3